MSRIPFDSPPIPRYPKHFAVDVILIDTNFWRGIRPCVKAAGVCDTFQQPIAVHPFGELGIYLVNMPHLGAVPTLTFSADADYHHLIIDILVGRKLSYQDGAIVVPDGPSLGVTMDRDNCNNMRKPSNVREAIPIIRTLHDQAGLSLFQILAGQIIHCLAFLLPNTEKTEHANRHDRQGSPGHRWGRWYR